MSDELDVLLRRAMKSLDDQVPSGYFEGLPRQTLARLEASMQTTGNRNERDPSTGAQPVTNEREEDSGLHDIRSLASSTKLRIARRSTMSPVVSDDDVLASSSAGWKAAVALPEPAKMVSLPDLASLPSRTKIEAIDREARAKAKTEATVAEGSTVRPAVDAPAEASSTASTATAVDAAVPASEAPARAIPAPATAKAGGGRGKLIAIAGIGVAAAAGAAIFLATSGGGDDAKSSLSYESKPQEPIAERTAQELPPPPPAPEPEPAPVVAAAEPEPEPEPAPPPVEEPKVVAKAETKDKDKDKPKVHKVEIRDTPKAETKPAVAAAPPPKAEPKKADGEGEPSFDELLKEAGVTDEKKEVKPKLDKKALSSADIKTGMSSVAGKAQACYQGTQGMAQVKLTVDPSGKVSKVTVTGAFAGTPVASCVEAAVKSATFPPWDGGPQSFGYSYLLAE